MRPKLTIRQESPADHTDVDRLLRSAFGQDDEAILVQQLRLWQGFVAELSLIAIYEGDVAGHILFTKLPIYEGGELKAMSLALAPLAVLPGCQGKGIGTALTREGLVQARRLGYASAVVLGHADYYPRFGFAPASKWGIRAPFDVPDDHFMAVELTKDSLKGVQGMVRYAAPFGIDDPATGLPG